MGVGCGQFPEADWTEYLFDPSSVPALVQHVKECAACREEAAELQRTSGLLGTVRPDPLVVRETLVRSVVREHLMSEQASAEQGPNRRSWLRGLALPSKPLVWAASVAAMILAISLPGLWPSTPNEAEMPLVYSSFSLVVEESATDVVMTIPHGLTYVAGDNEQASESYATPLLQPSASAAKLDVINHVFTSRVIEEADGSLNPQDALIGFQRGTASFHTLTYVLLDEGTYNITLSLSAPNQNVIASKTLPPVRSGHAQWVEALWVEWPNVRLSEPGEHKLVILVNGTVAKTFYLMVQ